MNPAPTPSFWTRATTVIRRDGGGSVGRWAMRRARRAFRANYEAVRWAAWRCLGRDSVTVNGCTMYIDRSDPGISRELALYRTHEPMATELAVRFGGSARTILDLGSNIGYYALLFLTRIEPRPKLIAIEPASRNIERLRRNLTANGLTDAATVMQVAVSDRCGEGALHLARESNWHTLLPADGRHTDVEAVPVITLDALVRELQLESLDLIRMDIEGYETVVFRAMSDVLRRFRPRLIVELHPQLVGPEPILALLRMLTEVYGYRAVQVVDRELDYAHLCRHAPTLTLETLLREDLSRRCFTVFMAPS